MQLTPSIASQLILGGMLAATCWGVTPTQEPSSGEVTLKEATVVLRALIERRNRQTEPVQVFWNPESIRVLHGPVPFPWGHQRLHRAAEPFLGPFEVRGLVLDGSGARIPGAEVRLAPLDAEGSPDWRPAQVISSGDAGYFVFENLLPERYHLRAELAGFKFVEIRVDTRRRLPNPVTLRLEVGSSADGIFLSPEASVGQSRLQSGTVLSVEIPGGFVPYLVRKSDGRSYLGNRDSMEERLPFLDSSERKAALARAHAFYDLALDLEAGPQRFYKLLEPLAQRMVHSGSMESPFSSLTPGQMPLALSGFLEYALYREWLCLEGLSLEALEKEPEGASGLVWLETWDRKLSSLRAQLVRLGSFDIQHRESVEPFLRAFMGMYAAYRVKRTPIGEEEPRQILAIPLGMVTVYVDHSGSGLTIQSIVMHD